MRYAHPPYSSFFFFNDTATTEIYTLSLHDALPISGKVLIRATAPDLAPAQTLVVIVPHGSSWMDPSVHPTFRLAAYQQDITVEINPHEPTVVPANGVSRAQLWVTLNRRLNPDEELQIRVKSVPGVGVQVLYDGIRQGNVTDLTIGAGIAPLKEGDILDRKSVG